MNPAMAPMGPAMCWRLGSSRGLTLDRPRVLAIVNVTPDSFSDGGQRADPASAARFAVEAIRAGADGVDVGGESTRPGAERVEPRVQIERVVPAIRAIRAALGPGPVISVDTTRAEVAQAAIDAGADAVNDVSAATEDPGMLGLVAQRGVGLVLMHRLRPPGEDVYSHQYAQSPTYGDVVREVAAYLAARAAAALAAGVDADAIVIDPGLGFGKSVEQNVELIRRSDELCRLGFPLLSGLSRKSFVGVVSGVAMDAPPAERLGGTVALSVEHFRRGARLFRVHDAGPVVQALRAAAQVNAAMSSDPPPGGRG
jgi:dihydropteroate synthase